MPIKFYRERDEPYGCFSNFSRHSFEMDGTPWQTVEHYFQAMKFPGTEQARLILRAHCFRKVFSQSGAIVAAKVEKNNVRNSQAG